MTNLITGKRIAITLAILLIVGSVITACSASAPSPGQTQPAQAKPAEAKPAADAKPAKSEPAKPAVAPTELKIVNFLPDKPPGNAFMHVFIDKVKTLSNGELVIKLVGGPEAIPPPDAPSAVAKGAIDMSNTMYTFINPLGKGMYALGRAEYTPEELRKRGAVTLVQEIMAKAGIHYLGATTPSKPMEQTVVYLKKPISKLDDFKGLKIGTIGDSLVKQLQAWGATPVSMTFADYYTGMERGVIDGYHIGIPGIQDYGLTPVTGAMLDETLNSSASGFLVNLDKWNKLPQSHKDVLTKAAIELEIDGLKLWDDIVGKVRADLAKAGVKFVKFSPADSAKYYRTYRETYIKEELETSDPQIISKLHAITHNPNFSRLK